MKNSLLFIVVVSGLLFSQCAPEQEATPQIDYNQASVDLMAKLAPQVAGKWTFREVHVKFQHNSYDQTQLGLTKDTVFRDLATLEIQPAATSRSAPPDARYAEFEGSIRFRGKAYPVYFRLLPNWEWINHHQGPQAFFLLEYNFPVGSHLTEPEEAFLNRVGLMGENYSLETTLGQPAMTWKGLNSGIDKIELRK